MKIDGPTGALKGYLPILPSDNISVTFTISNHIAPTLQAIDTIVLPIIAETKSLPTETPLHSDNLEGQLIYSVTNGNKSESGTGKKLYEVGEFIEEDTSLSTLDPATPVDNLFIQHNTNVLNMKDLGLSDADISDINSASSSRFSDLRKSYNDIQTLIKNTNNLLIENQKNINEATKAISAVAIIFDETTGNPIYDKLVTKLVELNTTKEDEITNYNNAMAEAATLYAEILSISQVIR